MYCPFCGSQNTKPERWETCQRCGCIFKILNIPDYKVRRLEIETYTKERLLRLFMAK
jgi:hypothetical protein